MCEHDSLAVVGGGAIGNGWAAAKAYGSHHLTTRDGRKQTVRVAPLGIAIANEDE